MHPTVQPHLRAYIGQVLTKSLRERFERYTPLRVVEPWDEDLGPVQGTRLSFKVDWDYVIKDVWWG